MNAPSNLTPSEAAWGAFYLALHSEVQRLEQLAQQKAVVSSQVSQAQEEATVNQRRPKANTTLDSSRASR